MAEGIRLTNQQARHFLLHRQGLLGECRFAGKQGALDYIREVGSVQFDPVDICGKNAELALHSRVKGFTKKAFAELLYEDRALVDYFDKNLCVLPVEDWPYFGRFRRYFGEHERVRYEIEAVRDEIKSEIRTRGALCSADLDYEDKVGWFWSDTRLSRAALERMYYCGELAVHHKKGAIKYYDLIERCIPRELLDAPEPFPADEDHLAWRVERRIGAVGLLWNRASDAWLGIGGLKAAERDAAFSRLLREGRLVGISIEGIKAPLYCRARDAQLIDFIKAEPDLPERCEFLAPFDNMLWDRKLIVALFGFDYKWEIYTPADKLKYGHYVLPVLMGDIFIGRIELVRDKAAGKMAIKNLWYEDGIRPTKARQKRIEACVKKLERFDKG